MDGYYPVWGLVGYFSFGIDGPPELAIKKIHTVTPALLFKSRGVLVSFLCLRDFISLICKKWQ